MVTGQYGPMSLSSGKTRRVAVLGGNRIPFARSNSVYASASNQDMLTAAIDGAVTRFGLEGERLGEVVAGAVLKHSRDFNLARESVLGSKLSPETPATDIQQACGTGLQAAIQVANKIALGQIEVGLAGGTDTTSDAPVAISEKLRKKLLKVNAARDTASRLKALAAIRPGDIGLAIPQNGEPRTGLSMGDHAALTALEWQITREDQDELAAASHQHLAAAYDAGFHDDLITPFRGVDRDNNLRADSSVEKLAKLKPVFGKGEAATMTAGNSTPLTDGASVVLLASEEWAEEHDLPVLAYLTAYETAAVDYVHGGEGLLMAPAYAMAADARARGPDAPGLRLLRDPRGVRLAGARDAQGVGGPGVLQGAPRPRRAAGCRSTASKLNVNGSSLAAGHPFAATGGRIVPVLAKLLAADRGRHRPRRDLDLRRRRPGRDRDPRAGLTEADRVTSDTSGGVDPSVPAHDAVQLT